MQSGVCVSLAYSSISIFWTLILSIQFVKSVAFEIFWLYTIGVVKKFYSPNILFRDHVIFVFGLGMKVKQTDIYLILTNMK